MEKEKLLPCPFCGSEAHPVECDQDNHYWSPWVIYCSKCYAELSRKKPEKTIKAWNKRHDAKGFHVTEGFDPVKIENGKECTCKEKTVTVKGDALNIARETYCPKHGHKNSCYVCNPENRTTERCGKH